MLAPEMISELDKTVFEKNGYLILDDFISSQELSQIRTDFESIRIAGRFKRAGIGKGVDFHLNDEVRLDETHWLEPTSLSPAQKIFWPRLENLKHELNQHFFLGLWDFEGHYSYYPPGGKYQPHFDRFSKDDARTISMVLYFNDDWKNSDGGELRIHPKDPARPPLDIAPMGGRLIFFNSADTMHEVLTTQRCRLSFAGWWKRRK